MSDKRNPLEQAVDVFFYAPLGLVMNADEMIPQLVKKGRDQVAMGRLFGQFAVQQGQHQLAKLADKVQSVAASTIDQLGDLAGRRPPVVDEPEPAVPDTPPLVVDEPAPAATVTPDPAAPPGSGTLAIPDYDSLSASQVVPRLAGLSMSELEAVRAYEAAHRGRKTILNKVAQLQG